MQSNFEFLWSEDEFTDSAYFWIFSWLYAAWINRGKVKSQNTKIHFENLQNKSVNISNNFLYFLITLWSHV